VALRAYVTSGGPLVTTRARCAVGARRTLTALSELGSGMAGDVCAALQAPRPLRWRPPLQRIARWSPSKTAAREKACARTSAVSATPEVAPDAPILRQAPDRYVISDAFASTTEATKLIAWSFLKNPACTSGANTGPPLAGCLLTGRLRGASLDLPSQGRRLSFDGLVDRHSCYWPASGAAPRSLKCLPTRATFSRNASTARTKRYGLDFVLYGPKTDSVAACLYRSQRTARDG